MARSHDTETTKINCSAEVRTARQLIRGDADLNSGANNRNHNSKRELASAAHPASGEAAAALRNHGDCRTCVVPVGNKKTKKSSLIIVSPFHQKADKSQIKKSNKTAQRRCKLNGQAAVPSFAVRDESSSHCAVCLDCLDCLDCVSRPTVQCGANCERQCDSNNNVCKQAERKRPAVSVNRMEETAENKEQPGGQAKVEPETAAPARPTELANLSKQNSLDSPGKSTSNSTAINSPSTESVWSNLREDYELGEVIGKFFRCLCL